MQVVLQCAKHSSSHADVSVEQPVAAAEWWDVRRGLCTGTAAAESFKPVS
jgi:hypothetical protein